jgi:hypothetical protein
MEVEQGEKKALDFSSLPDFRQKVRKVPDFTQKTNPAKPRF